MALSGYYLVPKGFTLNTYAYVLQQSFVRIGFRNSIFVTVVGTIISLFLTAITAYPLSREKLLGRKIVFGFMLFTMLFRGGIIPTYIVVRGVGMIDSLWALIIPQAISVFYMLIMIKFFKQIPQSLIDAARIDGYNDAQILFKIVIPVSTAVLATVALFYAVRRWNEYLPGVIYINSREKRVLQVVLRGMLQEAMGRDSLATLGEAGETLTPQTMRMASIIVTLLPILFVYPYLQKYFIKGVMLGAVKG
jgi:putative aldouronate transport system permease protein